MSLLDLLKGAQGGDGLAALGQQFGLDPATTQALAEKLAPAISGGVKQRAASEGGMEAVLGQLMGGNQASYFDQPEAAAAPAAQAAGADFLKNIFGNEEAAPKLAEAAAAQAGVPADKVQQMLPSLAAMLQGGLQQRAPDEEIQNAVTGMKAAGLDREGAGLSDLVGSLGGATSSGGLVGALKSKIGMGGGAEQPAAGGELGGLLAMLDSDGDGSPLNDIMGQLFK